VPKPLDPQLLFDTIESVSSSRAELETMTPPVEVGEKSPAPSGDKPQFRQSQLDRQAILARVEGDTALLSEVIDLFIADAPRLLAEIKESLRRNDSQALERAAHALKGSIGNFGAATAHDANLQLET